jgi:aspartyl-tRNA(Asn)/glutamyl-tRNA(Gln) amidotransferase subunit B
MEYEKTYRGYQVVIGLEIHAQLNTKTKIFSSESTSFDASDNENTSPVSAGLPGALPVLNKKAVHLAIKAGLGLSCEINRKSVFSRKNYFYPDLPKGYQISQYDLPICLNGKVEFFVHDKETKYKKVVRISRAHMEEDAGKSTHHGQYTLINYNRSGIPLLEIVSGPDMQTPVEAAEYAKTVRQILKYLDVCDGNLEEGSLRCDCNISVKKPHDAKLGTKVEIKNINSFRFIEKALEYEIDRQIDCLEGNEKIFQETRLYDPDKNRTFTMRTKEDAEDYRYFPDPDLLPLVLADSLVEKIKSELPELPSTKFSKLVEIHGLPENDATVLTAEKDVVEFYEAATQSCKNFKSVANWIMTEMMRELKNSQIEMSKSPVSPMMLSELINLIDAGQISGKIAKTVFTEMWKTKKSAKTIIEEQGLGQITDNSAIEKIIEQILKDNPDQVLEYKSGKTKVVGFFVGQIMRSSKGQASPEIVNKILIEKLK